MVTRCPGPGRVRMKTYRAMTEWKRAAARMGSVLALVVAVAVAGQETRDGPDEPERVSLTLTGLLRSVLIHNESLQVQAIEVEIGRRQRLAERGVFEPELVLGYDRVDSRRQNTTQERASTGLRPEYSERNHVYAAGLESLVPTGARIRLGYTLRDLRNSLQTDPIYGTGATNGEYASFLGVSVTQPLLKNAGFRSTLAGIRLAATASEVAFQEYRRQMMTVLSAAEAGYWNLYLAQRQVEALQESVALAETVLRDNQARLRTGVASELDVMESRAGLALRQTKLAEARQLLSEAHNRLTALFSDRTLLTPRRFVAVDEPERQTRVDTFTAAWGEAFAHNPDYLMQRQRLAGENIRLAYARNQRLPQLDLKGSYGLNGLGVSPNDSWNSIETGDFTSWTVGVELRIPLAGGIRPRHELHVARLRVEQALLGLKELETQLASAVNTSIERVRSTSENLGQYEAVIAFNEDVLRTQLTRLEVGKVESRKVLEAEADLIDARNALADAQVQHQRARLEQQLLQGTLLQTRGLEKSRDELESWMTVLLSDGRLDRQVYQHLLRDALRGYPTTTPEPASREDPGAGR